jgi:transposase
MLKTQGYNVSHKLVRQLLQQLGYSLQNNRKTKEGGGEHPDSSDIYVYKKCFHIYK